jgi:hypothetical protein
MYPYTKELTLDEALNILLNAKCQSYENDGKVYLTALDYATHILKQQIPPEGWGYAAYELDSGRYEGLPYGCLEKNNHWDVTFMPDLGFELNDSSDLWHNRCFKLIDLARVEGTDKVQLTTRQAYYLSENNSPIQKDFYHGIYYISKADYDNMPDEFKELASRVEGADTDKTEINAAQVEWLVTNFIVLTHFNNGKEWDTNILFDTDIQSAKEGNKFEILTSTYNALPQEFKDLAAPIPPSGIKPPATCCPKCYEVMTELKQEIALRENQIDRQQSQISKLITAYERKLDALGSLQAVEIDLQAVLNEVQPLMPF